MWHQLWRAGVVAWAAVIGLPVVASPGQAAPFDRQAWLTDFDALRDALTRDYANLEWAVARGMDLAATEARAKARLAAATNDHEARMALERFVRAFGDGHLELAWPKGQPQPEGTPLASLCARLGFRSGPDSYAVGTKLPDYRPLDLADPDAAGTLAVEGKRVAVLRIAEFGPGIGECDEALTALQAKPDGDCDSACAERVRERADQLFVAGIERRLRLLSKLKPDLLLVDLATNGGGNDSAIALAHMLGGDLPSPPVARLRGQRLADDLADKRAVLRAAAVQGTAADMITRLDAQLAAAEAEARRPCDRTGLWRGERVACSGAIRGPFFAGGLSPRPLGIKPDPAVAAILSSTARYTYTPGLWTGPVALLVDGDTASAAELAAAMLQDAGRAIVVGAPTFGAGCGWMLEPQPTVLPNSGGTVRMPDCSRLRADGRNEVDGITPDVAVGFRQYDTAKQRIERLTATLPQLLARVAQTTN